MVSTPYAMGIKRVGGIFTADGFNPFLHTPLIVAIAVTCLTLIILMTYFTIKKTASIEYPGWDFLKKWDKPYQQIHGFYVI